MASSFLINYYFIISVAGFLLLTFLGICCFINVEALKLKTEHKNLSGLACLVAACVYYIFNLDVSGNNRRSLPKETTEIRSCYVINL
jgi:hypothetical protein